MMDPGAVFAAMARSDRLDRLTSRVCRPLDKPATVRASADDAVDEEALDRVTDSVPVPVPASASA